MSDYLKPEHPLRTIEGSVARVDFFPDFVQWTPASSSKVAELEQKVQRQNDFVHLTRGIPFLVPLPVTSVDTTRHIYRQPRAPGFNMEGSEYEVQGGGFVDFFSKLTLPKRVRGFMTYLSVLSRLHENQLTFNDHKPDSVFLDPIIGLSLPDTDKVRQISGRGTAWQQELNESDSVFGLTLRSFFTRNKLTSRFVPRIFEGNIATMNNLTDGKQLLETIDFMINDGPKNKEHNGLMARLVTEEMIRIGANPPAFERGADNLIDLSPIQQDLSELREVFPNMGYNTSTAELIAHAGILKQREAYFREKDQNEYSSKIM